MRRYPTHCGPGKGLRKAVSRAAWGGVCQLLSKDPLRKPTEPGGIGVVVGPKWGASVLSDGSRTDNTGHGVLIRVRLRTSTGFLSIYGTYWPFVRFKDQLNTGESKLWSRVHDFCKNNRMHDTDPIRHIQSLYDQWASRDWGDGCKGLILGGDFNSTWGRGERGGRGTVDSH